MVLEIIAGHCSNLLQLHGNLFLSMFVAGLAGGFTHCLGMCSTFAMCGGGCGKNCGESDKMKDFGIAYHFGRLTTYGALGFLSAFFSKQIATFQAWPAISAVMLVIAGAMFLVSSLPECRHASVRFFGNLGYLKGVCTGFLPCGLIYAALMLAATTASPLGGMVAMWMFVIGTIPALTAANIGFGFLAKRYKNIMQRVTKSVMAINGLLLFIMAAKVMR